MNTTDKTEAAVYACIDPPILPKGTQVIRSEGWYQHLNPLLREPSSNEVILSKLSDESEIEQRVQTTIAGYHAHQIPFKWAIGPMSSPDRLEQEVAKRASTSWEFRGMAIDTDAVFPSPSGITIEVVNKENVADFLEAHLEGWKLQAFADGTQAKLIDMAKHPKYRCFVAKKNSRPIGSAATILKPGSGYLIGAVVIEEFRGCGAYRALTHARLQDLNHLGFPFAVSQARESTSAPALEKLGFETMYRAKIYRFDP